MATEKTTLTLDSEVLAAAKSAVRSGRAKSVSAWVNRAAHSHAEQEDLQTFLAEMLDETGGPATEQELAAARAELDAATWPE